MKAVTKRIIIILIICLIIIAVSNNQVNAKNSRDDNIVENAEDIDNSLKCKNPNYAHFIAHSQIDFSLTFESIDDVKKTIEENSQTMCIELQYVRSNDGINYNDNNNNIPPPQRMCGLLGILVKKYDNNNNNKFASDASSKVMKNYAILDFSLMGLTKPGKIKYSVEYTLQSGKVYECSDTFEIVYFPGWDNYVQYYYNATKTVENVKKETDANNGILVPGSYDYPLLSYEKLPDLIGPQAEAPRNNRKLQKNLVVTFAGKNSMKEIDELLVKFNTPNYKIILFVYDKSNWTSYDWIEDVIFIRILRTMKWWFVKHFLHPDLVRAYDYILMIDEDCNTKGLNPDLMLQDARDFGVQIGQPANGYGSYGSHNVVRLKGIQNVSNSNVINDSNDVQPEDIPIGTWTTFVECGPFTFFSSDVWPCVWNMLQPDVTCGYGYDLMWANCAPNRTAVLHHHTMIHENRKPGSGNNKNFGTRCAAEGLFLFQRLAHINMTPFDPQEVRDFDEVKDRVKFSEEKDSSFTVNEDGSISSNMLKEQLKNKEQFNDHISWIDNEINEKTLLIEKLQKELLVLKHEKNLLHDKK